MDFHIDEISLAVGMHLQAVHEEISSVGVLRLTATRTLAACFGKGPAGTQHDGKRRVLEFAQIHSVLHAPLVMTQYSDSAQLRGTGPWAVKTPTNTRR